LVQKNKKILKKAKT